ncbi:amylo-alpha-1,6-glucosidase [Spirochaeta lutea]|uniref:Amylo-alpha-1,6-glucosidase n=1 Tax=Spirochaeta lutea TaxID=1480694 RepID=A0A098QZ23_9SPIO|nr:glycogen debranching N-terminal domain-containing protein [Spirochaeta lutea]KGE72688.1 hypothetical protein DC28_06460 [Spirochaeta lutea]
MNLSKNIVLKENYTFLVTDEDGAIPGGERGLYSHDTRFLSRLLWQFDCPDVPETFHTLVAHSSQPDTAVFHHALIQGPSQILGVHRTLSLEEGRLADTLVLENTDSQPRRLRLGLSIDADFIDLFEARGFASLDRRLSPPAIGKSSLEFGYTDGPDTYGTHVTLKLQGPDGGLMVPGDPGKTQMAVRQGEGTGEAALSWDIEIPPRKKITLTMKIALTHPSLNQDLESSLPSYSRWREGFPESLIRGPVSQDQGVLNQAIQDLRALMLISPQGSIPAAGIPWFVAAFGRDSLITAAMLLPHHPWVARGVLEYLGHYQGREVHTFRGEEPGKIMHEIRFGELARKGKIPHTPYYGTIDATPLYIILLQELVEQTGSRDLIAHFQPQWEACLAWMMEYGDADGDGFLEYISAEPGKGLVVQSWKDSDDSMSHGDGSLAQGYIRPAEVQGYAYRAYMAAAEFYEDLGNPEKSSELLMRAQALQLSFDRVFWSDSLDCYAMALDGDSRPLAVKSSNAGQLLWSGIVPENRAPRLVSTLMGPELYSGWGIRTLGTQEARYNPVSYHNGSVWPHDTALIARGLWDYGFRDEAGQLVRDLFDLAGSQGDRRLPELIAGYSRGTSPPVPYPVACRPQSWDAAALVYLHPLLIRE